MYYLEAGPGDHFSRVAEQAQKISQERQEIVEFEFNDIKCRVNSDTNLERLWVDYSNAHLMEWETVGPNCVEEYDGETKAEIERRELEREVERRRQQEEYDRMQKAQEETMAKKLEGVEMEFKDKDLWDKGVENNKDPYGGAVYSYAERWARLMQYEMQKFQTLVRDVADQTSRDADVEGITGFMYGAAVSTLSSTWKYGEELRKWHNKDYEHEGDGVVNPAILTIKSKE